MTKDEARDCDHGRMKGKCEVCDLQAELDATNRQVEILSDALAESRREVAALKAVREDWGPGPHEVHSLPPAASEKGQQ
jgi:hypothetical protein